MRLARPKKRRHALSDSEGEDEPQNKSNDPEANKEATGADPNAPGEAGAQAVVPDVSDDSDDGIDPSREGYVDLI